MNTKNIVLAVFLVAVAVIIGVTVVRQGKGSTNEAGGDGGKGGKSLSNDDAVEISMLYGTEKKDWIEASAARFQTSHPEIKLTLKGMGSTDAMNAILEGREKPTIFSPADSVMMNLLIADWETQYHSPLVPSSGPGAPQPLMITPLVFAVWEDRAQALMAKEGAITWASLHDAVTAKQGWAAVGGKAEWGFVKLGHTDPTRSNSGLQSITLMAMEHFGRTNLTVADVLDPAFQTWFTELEAGVTKFELSTGTFMTDMVRYGPSKYDIAVVYESLAIGQLANAQGRWGNLKVYYPKTTLWSDSPAAILEGDWVTPAQKAAATTWLQYLLSKEVQTTALAYGFRPADLSIPLKSADANNPFNRMAPYGIQVDIGSAASAPDGPVIQNLMMLWTRQVQKK
jgi:ABC-type Fe3+ transport system substrate-binding protein